MLAGSLQQFVDAAETAQRHHTTVCPPGASSLTVDSTATVTSPARLDFNGSTITKSPTMDGWVLDVRAPGVSILNLNVDGNQAAGARGGGIIWQGGGGLASGDHIFSTSSEGFEVTGVGSSLVVDNSSSDLNVNSTSTGDGFFASRGARLQTVNTSATHNDRSGFFLVRAAAGSSVAGSSAYNTFAGLEVQATNGFHIPDFTSTDDWHYGLYVGGDSNACIIGDLHISNTGIAQGRLKANSFGAGIEFFGATNCQVNSITDAITYKGGSGYGLAIARQSPNHGFNMQGSSGNVFQRVNVAGTGNPAIDITGMSSNNTIVNGSASGCSVGVNIGEGTVANNGNVFDRLVLQSDWFSGVGIESSDNNVFKDVQLLDVGGRYPSDAGDGAIRLIGTAAGNLFGSVTVEVTPRSADGHHAYKVPQYVVYADYGTAHNRVGITALAPASFVDAPFLDHGSNLLVRGVVTISTPA